MATSHELELARGGLRGLAQQTPESLPTDPALNDARTCIDEIAALAQTALGLPLERYPSMFLRALTDRARNLANAIDDLRAIGRKIVPGSNPEVDLPVKANNFATSFRELYQDLMASFGYLGYVEADLAGAKGRAEKVISDIISANERFTSTCTAQFKRIESLEAEVSELVERLRAEAAASGAGIHSKDFDDVARKHERAALRWLVAVAVLAVITIGLATLFLWAAPPIGKLTEASAVQEVVSRIVMIGLGLAATAWAARVFRIRSHLAAQNGHRATALKTFALFHASAHDRELRDEVLKSATNCVFAPGITGFVDAKEEKANNEVLEIIRLLPWASKTP